MGWIDDGEWLSYTADFAEEGTYQADFRIASPSGSGSLRLLVDGQPVAQDLSIPWTGGCRTWQTATLANVGLPSGRHTVKLFFVKGGST